MVTVPVSVQAYHSLVIVVGNWYGVNVPMEDAATCPVGPPDAERLGFGAMRILLPEFNALPMVNPTRSGLFPRIRAGVVLMLLVVTTGDAVLPAAGAQPVAAQHLSNAVAILQSWLRIACA